MDSSQQLRHRMFARHAHPVSAWTRLLTTPLVVVPFWTRRADVGAAVLVWFAINPIITPEPSDRNSFATRAILGEERWVAHPELDRTMSAVNGAGVVALAAAILAAGRRRMVPTVLGVAAAMAFTLYGWRRYADLYDGEQNPAEV
ncbi:DUF6653 family protein [Nocardia cyriacigeorgica]|uniref:DUF6653 family protein n=1 Tax=Nocardia cyriacigeorgica TaxID=135487 RepID=UPI001894EAF2|nr:DUF6653 family protein [Nocardia cyriacigeorgica]MBF6287758.1 hypothetical protein [Nocardia cyriacigeorgica]